MNIEEMSQEELDRKIAVYRHKLRLIDAKDDLIEFTKATMPDPKHPENAGFSLYRDATHHRAIAEALQEVDAGNIKRLLITVPPRHGKSELASRRMPAWFLGRDPTRQLIFATYNDTFANEFGLKVREIINSDIYQKIFPGVIPKSETRAAERMWLKQGGMGVFTGVGGPITGRGADLLLIDDPFKNRDEAESQVIRDKRWDWYTSTAYTRLMPGGRIVIICTRWHEDDIVGRLLSRDYMSADQIGKWTHLNLPAIAYENTDHEKALWPESFPLEELKNTREVLGPRDWNALYQQRPTPPEGAFFHRAAIERNLYRADELPSNLTKYTGFDLAVSMDKKRDTTCCLTAGLDDDDVLWILPEVYWEQRPADQSIEFITEHIRHHDPVTIYVEKGKLDRAVGPFLEKHLSEQKIYKYFEKMYAQSNKGARATAIRGRIEQNKVRFPKEAYWWPAALDEMLKFTGSGDDKRDDFVDALSLIGQGLASQVYTNTQSQKRTEAENPIGTLGWVKENADKEKRRRTMMGAHDGW